VGNRKIPSWNSAKSVEVNVFFVRSSLLKDLFPNQRFYFTSLFASDTPISQTDLEYQCPKLSIESSSIHSVILNKLFESAVDGRTEIRNALVEFNSGNSTLANALRSKFKLLVGD